MKMPMDCRFIERQHIGVATPPKTRRAACPRRWWREAAEIRAMDDEKLNQQVANLLAEWRHSISEAVGQLTATARTRQIRKDIARIKTIQTEREIEAELATFAGSRNTKRQAAVRGTTMSESVAEAAVAVAQPATADAENRPGGQRQDGEDRRGRGRLGAPPSPLSQAHYAHEQVLGPRRAERLQAGGYRPDRGNAAAFQAEALDCSRNRRAGCRSRASSHGSRTGATR